MAGESIAYRQLAAHRNNPSNQGKTCRNGLWRYSRHPNYFFEWLHWFSYAFLVVDLGAGWLVASLAGPVAVSYTHLDVYKRQPLKPNTGPSCSTTPS